jgi:adenosylmethionine-8-amino-7-oxononanoate aminotransferase
MRIYDAALLDELLEEAARHDILCIADEVLTGFGRTGKLFAGEYLRHKADIICLSKGLTGGTMALGVTAATEKIFRAFLSDDKRKTLFHGHSFTANPIACSASLASLDLLLDEDCLRRIGQLSRRHQVFLDTLRSFPSSKMPVRWAPSWPSRSTPAGTNISTPSDPTLPAQPWKPAFTFGRWAIPCISCPLTA